MLWIQIRTLTDILSVLIWSKLFAKVISRQQKLILIFLVVFQGIKDLENRKDWPLSVLRKVLEELVAETPKDLLAK